MRKLSFLLLLFPIMAFANPLQDAQELVSAFTHGAGRVVWVHRGPAGLQLIRYEEEGKVKYGWMTSDGKYFLPNDNRQCVIDFYGPRIGGALCMSVPYNHGHFRKSIAEAKAEYDRHMGIN